MFTKKKHCGNIKIKIYTILKKKLKNKRKWYIINLSMVKKGGFYYEKKCN